MNKIRTAIFGGTFDPVHVGHTTLAAALLSKGLAQEVWFMVSPQNPHKQGQLLTDENIRLQMVRLAVEHEPRFAACDFEFGLPRPSYTYNTLRALGGAFPDREFLLLVGADNWAKFRTWYRGDDILNEYPLVVYPRGTASTPPLPPNVQWLDSPLLDVSSTQVRTLLAAGNYAAATKLLHPKVLHYIKNNNPYK